MTYTVLFRFDSPWSISASQTTVEAPSPEKAEQAVRDKYQGGVTILFVSDKNGTEAYREYRAQHAALLRV